MRSVNTGAFVALLGQYPCLWLLPVPVDACCTYRCLCGPSALPVPVPVASACASEGLQHPAGVLPVPVDAPECGSAGACVGMLAAPGAVLAEVRGLWHFLLWQIMKFYTNGSAANAHLSQRGMWMGHVH